MLDCQAQDGLQRYPDGLPFPGKVVLRGEAGESWPPTRDKMLVIGMPLAATKNEFCRPRGQSKGAQGGIGFHGRSPLALVEAFFDVPSEQLAALEQRLVTLKVCRGEVLVRQGDDADALYLVSPAALPLRSTAAAWPRCVSGSPIGEIAFFADGKRTATVTALRDSIVLKLPEPTSRRLAKSTPPF